MQMRVTVPGDWSWIASIENTRGWLRYWKKKRRLSHAAIEKEV
jgi:hypothetical protein